MTALTKCSLCDDVHPPHTSCCGTSGGVRSATSRWDPYLRSVYRKDGRIYECVGVIDSPAVCLRDVISGDPAVLVIGSLVYEEYERLRPEPDGAA